METTSAKLMRPFSCKREAGDGVVAFAFLDADRHLIVRRFELKRGEPIQGLLACVRSDQRVYVVTVPAPREHSEHWDRSPRIVTAW